MENKYVWIENIQSCSGRHRLRKEMKVGSMLWLPSALENSDLLDLLVVGDKVYHLLDSKILIGVSEVMSAAQITSSSKKSLKQIVCSECLANKIPIKSPIRNIDYKFVELSNFKRYNIGFSIADAFTDEKIKHNIFVSKQTKNDYERLVTDFLEGKEIIKVPFNLWYLLISVVNSD